MTATANAQAMLNDFEYMLARAGYTRGSSKYRDRADPIGALLADARLYCESKGISWRKAVDLAKDQLAHDLDELAWMASEHINLRAVNHEAFVD